MSDDEKYWEQQWMVLKDQYSELARAIGMEEVDSWWGDPLGSHEEVVEFAKKQAEKAGMYDDLCD